MAEADCLITGDDDLLVLDPFRGLRIRRRALAWGHADARGRSAFRMTEALDILLQASLGRDAADRDAAGLRDPGRADLRARGRAQPRIEGIGDAGRHDRLARGLPGPGLDRGGPGGAGRHGHGPAPRRAHRPARAVPARLRPRHHPAQHERRVLHLPRAAAWRDHAAADRAVPSAGWRWLADLPVVGPVLAQQTALTLLALALVPAWRGCSTARPSGSRSGPSAKTLPRSRRRE